MQMPCCQNHVWQPWLHTYSHCACLQVRQQTLYILQVLPSGRFVKVQSIGALCNDDDQLVLEMHEEQERHWQNQRSQVDTLTVTALFAA